MNSGRGASAREKAVRAGAGAGKPKTRTHLEGGNNLVLPCRLHSPVDVLRAEAQRAADGLCRSLGVAWTPMNPTKVLDKRFKKEGGGYS